MRIGIDLKPFFSSSRYRGIGMYSRSFIDALIKQDKNKEHTYHFLNMYGEYDNDPVMTDQCFLYNYFTGPKVTDVGERQLFRDVRMNDLLEAQVADYIRESNIDMMIFPSPVEYGNIYKKEWFEGIFKVGILYDVIPYIFPEQCLGDKCFKEDYEAAIEFMKEMDLLLAISECSKQDAVKYLGIPPEKIVVIYAGIDEAYKRLKQVNIKDLKKKYGITGSFIMFAGGIDFKKNIEFIIRAYSKLGKENVNRYQLVITGNAPEDVLNLFKHMAYLNGVSDRVICTGFIPQEDLVGLYNITDLFVFPSLYEGFGLPVIEAMACGARVLTSETSSLGEIAKGYAVLVNPNSEKSILKGMKYMIEHPVETRDKLEEAEKYALSYTWEEVGKKSYNAIFNLASKRIEENNKIAKVSKVLKADKKLFHNIADLYIENNVPLTEDEMWKIVKHIDGLENLQSQHVISGKSRIFLDMTVVSEWVKAKYSTGIGRVSVQLLRAISKYECIIPIIVQREGKDVRVKPISKNNYKVIDANLEITSNDIFFMPELQIRGVQVPNEHPYANSLREKGIKCFAVLYDILPLQYPMYFENKTANMFNSYVNELVDNYDGILCDSRSVADELVQYCKEKGIKSSKDKEVKVGYFHLGPNSFKRNTVIQEVPQSIKVFFEKNINVFVMVGTIEPRKGHESVVKAFEKAWAEGIECCLCIVGHMGWNMERFMDVLKQHKELGNRLAFFEGVSDATLEYIYQNATGLIQASAGEGFGLPLIEAGQYNLPIMCSDIPVFHEVAGENALYFKAMDSIAINECLKSFLSKERSGELPNSSQIKLTSWDESGQKVINMIKRDTEWYSAI